MLLASAGLLDGHTATAHWAFIPCLRRFKKVTVQGKAEGYPRCRGRRHDPAAHGVP